MLRKKIFTGLSKKIFILKIKLGVFFHYLPDLITGKITIRKFILLLRRLLCFLNLVQNNKFVKAGNKTKLDLYIPSYPSKAFFTACDKFKVFENKLPCVTVLISVTSGCRFDCQHCYQRLDKGKDVDISILVNTIKKLQEIGIAFFNVEGGEPFIVYDRLKKICEAIDDRSEIWINSTGDGITLDRMKQLKKLNVSGIMFSLHHSSPEELNEFMGKNDAWEIMEKGIEITHNAKLGVAFNSCLLKNDFYNGKFESVMNKAKDFNASLIQIIVPKPSGAWLESSLEPFSKDDLKTIKEKVSMYNLGKKYEYFPAIFAQAVEEDEDHFGCTAGGIDRFYINAKGDVQPCEFLNISFGNIQDENFEDIYERMRDAFCNAGEKLMCEKLSENILKTYKKFNLKSLPLSKNLSNEIIKNMDRGGKIKFYEKINSLR